jgi:aspartyl/glutamyl-tRNA(Asn/Gln) amidotransferase C subunit
MDFTKTVQALARLSRIGLKEGEDVKIGKEIEAILGYISRIKEATPGDAHSTPGVLRNVMRDDTDETPGGTYTEALLKEVPHREDGYVRVKKIL